MIREPQGFQAKRAGTPEFYNPRGGAAANPGMEAGAGRECASTGGGPAGSGKSPMLRREAFSGHILGFDLA